MRIKRTKHASAFTIIPNAIAQHRRLSLTARGLLGLFLSLPEITSETVKELTEDVAEGQKRVTDAMKELQTAGYVVCTRVQNDRGHWSTHVEVFDLPQLSAVEPEPESPKSGRPKLRIAGLNPFGEKNQGKNPPTPVVDTTPSATADEVGGDDIQDPNSNIGRAAGLLTRLGMAVPALKMKPSDVMALAPLAAEWIARGATELQIRNELAEGLPTPVKSPRSLVANRLERKMPPVPVPVVRLVDCAECGHPLPRGQQAGICGRCAGVAPAAPMTPAYEPQEGSDDAASLLAAIRQRRAAGTIKGTSRRTFTTVAHV
ncbi:hypothetical protein [Streptomyces sp. NPDC048489]|uniref:hypothetical protein n=1 Tax=Streptomyces sp. NPDC048489 TaxID=3154504 RepID=UPI0034346660